MRILVIGSGGREHALCWAIAASPLCDQLYCAPGNPGIAKEASCVPIAATDSDAILTFAKQEKIDFVIVGPEAPLVAGLVDKCEAVGIAAFGPSAAAAALEGSKGFTKDLCAKYGIPTARYARFADPTAAKAYLRAEGAPIVVKADGLAAGKGVTVAMTLSEAEAAIDEALIANRFGAAGAEVVIEEFLEGEEASFFVLSDGQHALPLASAQDHKRVFDGDKGPNTGGMGAYSPAPCVTPAIADEVMARIIRPTLDGMAQDGRPYKGVLYAGLMLTATGPQLIEYNVRFGDPECQVLLPRLKSDLLPALLASRDGVLKDFDLRWRDEAALGVVLAAQGYPDDPLRGSEIRGLEAAAASDPRVQIFHAGTTRVGEKLLADGGRVLNIVALGNTLAEARDRAYAVIDRIDWPEGFCRRDIGWRALQS
ncbi:MAG TPA: phosphoribosylamine--glycine ligase [Stellaceae bacterium]|nr:phosphoribosylamine--glycine ligase [Stellaceae bacterium]